MLPRRRSQRREALRKEDTVSDYAEVRRNILRNTISNYVRTVVAMAVGLITFRLIFQTLTREEFGFWALLWSVFGYGILLDFGFGFAAQKRVAELTVKEDWEGLSRVLSTILFFYFGVAAVLGLTVLLGSHVIVGWFKVSAENAEPFRHLLVVFFIGIGLAFPMGIFPEILRGQQRIRLANYIITAFLLLRLILIAAAVHYHWGFMAIMLIALGSSLLPDFVAMPLALRRMPQVKLRPSNFSKSAIGETAAFSVFAYLTTATNLILGKSDQLVLGATLGVTAIAVYQAGAKVAEVFRDFTKQMQDTLAPAAAHLHASGDHAALRHLLVNTTRWAMVIATPLYLLCAFHLDALLQLLTGERSIPHEVWLTGQLLLFWYYASIPTHSVFQRIYMMTGHERKLTALGITEAVLNLALSIALVLIFRNVVCVAIGSLIPTLFVGWFRLWPWLSKDAGLTSWELLTKTSLPVWLACLPVLALLAIVRTMPQLQFSSAWATVLVHGSIAGSLAVACIVRFALTPEERRIVKHRLLRRTHTATPTPEAA